MVNITHTVFAELT